MNRPAGLPVEWHSAGRRRENGSFWWAYQLSEVSTVMQGAGSSLDPSGHGAAGAGDTDAAHGSDTERDDSPGTPVGHHGMGLWSPRTDHTLRTIYIASALHGFSDACAKLSTPGFVFEIFGSDFGKASAFLALVNSGQVCPST